MIQWIPLADYWTPINQKRVQSIGLEYRFDGKIRLTENTDIGFISNYSYTGALIKEIAKNESPDILNKQLVYTPSHQANALFSYRFKNLGIQTNINYTGKQYTRADNKAELNAFWLVDVSVNYGFDVKRFGFTLFAKANNIFNTEYMAREWYPMPGISYETGIKLGINKG
jgi:outer membrane receptor protein involved in Fe transport